MGISSDVAGCTLLSIQELSERVLNNLSESMVVIEGTLDQVIDVLLQCDDLAREG